MPVRTPRLDAGATDDETAFPPNPLSAEAEVATCPRDGSCFVAGVGTRSGLLLLAGAGLKHHAELGA